MMANVKDMPAVKDKRLAATVHHATSACLACDSFDDSGWIQGSISIFIWLTSTVSEHFVHYLVFLLLMFFTGDVGQSQQDA